jgi:hypothetical protein
MIHSIKEWFKAAKPEPTVKDAWVQIGCHYEEVAEMADALWDKEVLESAENAAITTRIQRIASSTFSKI